MAQCKGCVWALTLEDEIQIVDTPNEQRDTLDRILEESFEGWYLRHARKILHEIETVRVALSEGTPVGLVMLKTLGAGLGYVFYVAVDRAHRKQGIGRLLLDDALRIFRENMTNEVFASVEHDNVPSERLFAREGFTQTSFAQVSSKYGPLHAINMYRIMVVVPGEVLLHKLLA